VFGRLEVERLRLHDLRFKLAVAKQMEVDRDIANTTKEVAVQLDRDQMQTAWGIWRLYRSSMRQMDVTDCPVCALYEV
jgi:Tfp pilus assembly protein PilW